MIIITDRLTNLSPWHFGIASLCPYISDSQRSEERKQQRAEEARLLESNLQHKERDRKRKLTALPVKVSPMPLYTAIGLVADFFFSLFLFFTYSYLVTVFPLLFFIFIVSIPCICNTMRLRQNLPLLSYCVSELISLIMLVIVR
jgi:hypothetical protein